MSVSEIQSVLSSFLFKLTQRTWSTSCLSVISVISYSVWSHLYTQNWLSLQWNTFSIVLILIESWAELRNGERFAGNRCWITLKTHIKVYWSGKRTEFWRWNQRRLHFFLRANNTRHEAKKMLQKPSFVIHHINIDKSILPLANIKESCKEWAVKDVKGNRARLR